MDFKVSESEIHESLIGEIVSNYPVVSLKNSKVPQSAENIRKALKSSVNETIDLSYPFDDFCVLPKNKLVLAHSADSCLTVYNENLNKLETIREIERNVKFSPKGIATNSKDRIYITDWKTHQIIITDLNFQFIKKFGSLGPNYNSFIGFFGIRCNNNNVFVCDYGNERIQVFDEELECLLQTHKLNFPPTRIEILNETFCILDDSNKKTRFYNNLMSEISSDSNSGRINEIHSNYYVYDMNLVAIICYDQYGKLIEKVSINHLKEYLHEEIVEGVLIYFNNNLYIRSYGQKKLLKLAL